MTEPAPEGFWTEPIARMDPADFIEIRPAIHAAKDVTRDGSQRVVRTRCGQTLTQSFEESLVDIATGFESRVTCLECRAL